MWQQNNRIQPNATTRTAQRHAVWPHEAIHDMLIVTVQANDNIVQPLCEHCIAGVIPHTAQHAISHEINEYIATAPTKSASTTPLLFCNV